MSAEALAPVQALIAERVKRIQEFSKQKGGTVDASPTATPVGEAHASLCRAGEALAQQARNLHFLLQDGTTAEHAQGVARDLQKAVEMYDSWAGTLLSVAMAPVRKATGTPCALVLQTVSGLVSKAVVGHAQASDVGRVQETVDALKSLQMSGAATTAKLLRESAKLVLDAAREVREAAAEAKEGGGSGAYAFGDDVDGGGGDDDDDDEDELLADEAVSAPLEQLVSATAEALLAAAADGVSSASDATLSMLITCGQTASTVVDSTVASAHEDDVGSVRKNAASLGKVVAKLHTVLAQRCGMEQHARRRELEAGAADGLKSLTAACAKLLEPDSDGVGALSIS
jgi:hypothetical protein